MLSPFSGLSLILHLAVIGIGKFFDVFPHLKPHRVQLTGSRREDRIIYDLLARGLSVIIIVVLSSAMLLSLAVAIQTSERVGQDEWQRRYAKKTWVLVRNYSDERLVQLIETDTPKILSFINFAKVETKTSYDALVSNSTNNQ